MSSTTRKIAHNTIVQIVGKGISTVLGLVAFGLLTRYFSQNFGVHQFGWYVTVTTFLGFAGILIDLGLIPVTAQMMSEPRFDKKVLFKNLITFRFVTAGIFFTLMPVVVLFFPYPTEVKVAVAFMTLSFLSISLNQVFIGFLQHKLKMYIQALGEVFGRIVLIVGLLVLMYQQATFYPIIGMLVLASIAYTVFLWVWCNKLTPVSFAYNKEIWKVIFIKSWPITVSIIFNVVYLKGDILLLSLFTNQTDVAIYGAAYRVIDILAQMAMMVMGVILPLLAYHWSRKAKDTFRYQLQQAFDLMMMLVVPVTIGTILVADKIMVLVAGEEFLIAGGPLKILALAVFGVYLGAVFGHTAVAIDKQKQTMWIYISNAVITLIGYLIFIPKFGYWGAAWMTLFSEAYAGILLLLVIRHYSKVTPTIHTFVKTLFAGFLMAVAIVAMAAWHVLLIIPVAGVVYGGVLFMTGAVSKNTIREVLSLRG